MGFETISINIKGKTDDVPSNETDGFETISINIKDHCAYIILSRPKRLNAFDMKLG